MRRTRSSGPSMMSSDTWGQAEVLPSRGGGCVLSHRQMFSPAAHEALAAET
jgi:hypothetical protein